MNRKIILSAFAVVVILVVWYFAMPFIHALEIGPNPMHRFSPNYVMVTGHLYFYPDPENYDKFEIPVDEYVESFSVQQSWLLGKTEKGYFAINMDLHETYYPLDTIGALTEKTGYQISSKDWVDEYKERMTSKYLQKNPAVVTFKYLFNASLIALAVLCTLLLYGHKTQGNQDHTGESK